MKINDHPSTQQNQELDKKLSGGSRAVIIRQKLVLLFGGVCSYNDCKITEKLEFAHILPTNIMGKGRGSCVRVKDVKDHPASYRLLCSKHHLEYDTRKGLDLIIE